MDAALGVDLAVPFVQRTAPARLALFAPQQFVRRLSAARPVRAPRLRRAKGVFSLTGSGIGGAIARVNLSQLKPFLCVCSLLAMTTSILAAGDSRCYELRTYTAAPGKLDELHARFRNHTC